MDNFGYIWIYRCQTVVSIQSLMQIRISELKEHQSCSNPKCFDPLGLVTEEDLSFLPLLIPLQHRLLDFKHPPHRIRGLACLAVYDCITLGLIAGGLKIGKGRPWDHPTAKPQLLLLERPNPKDAG